MARVRGLQQRLEIPWPNGMDSPAAVANLTARREWRCGFWRIGHDARKVRGPCTARTGEPYPHGPRPRAALHDGEHTSRSPQHCIPGDSLIDERFYVNRLAQQGQQGSASERQLLTRVNTSANQRSGNLTSKYMKKILDRAHAPSANPCPDLGSDRLSMGLGNSRRCGIAGQPNRYGVTSGIDARTSAVLLRLA